MAPTITKNIISLVALLAICHFVNLVPHILCSSLVEANGHTIEITDHPCPDDFKLIGTSAEGSTEENGEHHHHCMVSVPPGTEITAIKTHPPHLNQMTYQWLSTQMENYTFSTQCTAVLSNKKNNPFRGATGQFIHSVRLIS